MHNPTSLHVIVEICTNVHIFCYKVVHCGLFVWCIVVFVRFVCWYLTGTTHPLLTPKLQTVYYIPASLLVVFSSVLYRMSPGPLFTRQTDVLPLDLVKFRGREIGCYNDRFALKFDRQLGSTAAEVPLKFQSDWKSLNPNLAASRLREILR